MRLMEVGTKAQSMGKKEQAYDFFDQAYDLYALFWGIQMKVVNTSDVSSVSGQEDTNTNANAPSSEDIAPLQE